MSITILLGRKRKKDDIGRLIKAKYKELLCVLRVKTTRKKIEVSKRTQKNGFNRLTQTIIELYSIMSNKCLIKTHNLHRTPQQRNKSMSKCS